MRSRLTLLVSLIALVPVGLRAQEHRHGHEAQLGQVTFPVSCNAEAQQRFNRAMAGLHSFWWEDGDQAFGAVLQADSTCAMAYWGLALNAWGNPLAGGPGAARLETGAAAADRAATLGAPTAREHGFIAAARALFHQHATTSNPDRLRAYSDTLARLYRDQPGDLEVAIYYALSLIATAPNTDTTFTRQKQAATILTPLFEKHPQHPGLAHYIIHANDSPKLASLALDAARRYATIAPVAPHAQHMPTHIFVRLGLWDETVESNRRSFDASVAYAASQGGNVVTYEAFHALDYMVYGYLQRGRDREARAVLSHIVPGLKYRDLVDVLTSYNRVALETRLPLELADWRTAAALPVRGPAPVAEMLSRYARGIGAARAGDAQRARAEAARLAEIEAGLSGAPGYSWGRVAGIKRRAVSAWVLLAAGDTAGALREAKEAADLEDITEKHPVTPGELLPARELEGDMLFALGRYADARRAYRTTLEREPGRARSMFGTARAAELAGDTAAAKQGYAEFLKLMEKADGNRPEIGVARRAVASR